tara:strand:- start:299 stop:1348 length:1050 start_codon:yes stop_codon:yes gene_type:complete
MEKKIINLWNVVLKTLKVNYYNNNIYNEILDNLKKIDYKNVNYIKKKIDNYDTSIIEENDYMDMDIKNYINNKLNKCDLYEIENKFNLYIYYGNIDISKIKNKLIFIIKLLSEYFDFKKNRDIHIFLTPFKKKFNNNLINNKSCIYKKNINSGLTYIIDGKIIIYRIEELEKVLIHEFIHSMKIDDNIKNIKTDLNINKELLLNETLTEILAEIFYYLYLNLEYKINLSKILNLELKFSTYQTIQLLKFFDYTKIEDLLFKNDKKKYKDYSNSIEYFIIKTSILYNIEEFINNFFDNGYLIPVNHNKFEKFIRKTLYSSNFVNNINKNFNNVAFINSNKMVLYDNIINK